MRQTDSTYTQTYKDKNKAKRYAFDFYATLDDERVLIELLEQAKADKQNLKNIVKQALNDYFAKNQK